MSGAVAVILSAGESTRMGVPKALLDAGGESFVARLARVFGEAGCAVRVVVGHDAARVRTAAPALECVDNVDWRLGQLSSVRVGLRAALDAGAERVLVHPVDVPLITALAARAVLAALSDGDAAVPQFRGQAGHPLGLTASAALRILAWTDLPHLEAALSRLRVAQVAVEEEAVTQEADTPAEYEALFARPPRLAAP